jgi:hypothetical protein
VLTIHPHPGALLHHHDSDDEFGHEHLMSPEEEAELRRLLEIRQVELDECGTHMKGMTPAQKKRLRNKHASCVSRLKKKLYICNLVRELEKARDTAASAVNDLSSAKATIAQLRQDNGRLLAMTNMKSAVLASSQAGSSSLASILAPSPITVPSPMMAVSAPSRLAMVTPPRIATTSASAAITTTTPAAKPATAKPGSFCLCRAPASDAMMKCDRCTEWFHVECVGLNKHEAEAMSEWCCFECNSY